MGVGSSTSISAEKKLSLQLLSPMPDDRTGIRLRDDEGGMGWKIAGAAMIKRFEMAGVICQRVMIDPAEMALFAASSGKVVDAECRLAFARFCVEGCAGEKDFPRTIQIV
jgi:hypothetical protein